MDALAESGSPPLRDRLAVALPVAMKRRDRVAVAALRSALAAIADAEAVPHDAADAAPRADSEHVAAGAAGLGAAEVARLALTEADVIRVVAGEVAERERAAVEYEDLGRHEAAGRLRAEADALRAVLAADEVGDGPAA